MRERAQTKTNGKKQLILDFYSEKLCRLKIKNEKGKKMSSKMSSKNKE
jgi:hypothetical protein